MPRHLVSLVAAGAVTCIGAAVQAAPIEPHAVVETYADIAHAMYGDAHFAAVRLQEAVRTLVAEPSAEHLFAARTAWRQARVPYQQTEVYRFGNPIVDDWEGKVNAWPLDEGLIDYVDNASYGEASEENPLYTANVIASTSLSIGGETVDVTTITPALLADSLQEAGGVEANVATGYHAIEFLLWGQDLHGTGPGAGERPWTDYAKGDACTGGHCDRRGQYLQAATDLLVDDLAWMTGQWAEGGDARQSVLQDPQAGLTAMLTGFGSLSYGEMAGERMKLGLLLNDPEEEHDCFSDNTHNSHYYDVIGMVSVYNGTYTRIDGSKVGGASLAALVAEKAPDLDAEVEAKLARSVTAFSLLKVRAETVEAYDQMLAADNAEGGAVVQAAIDSLIDQTQTIERIVAALELQPIAFEGSESLDNPAAVFQ